MWLLTCYYDKEGRIIQWAWISRRFMETSMLADLLYGGNVEQLQVRMAKVDGAMKAHLVKNGSCEKLDTQLNLIILDESFYNLVAIIVLDHACDD